MDQEYITAKHDYLVSSLEQRETLYITALDHPNDLYWQTIVELHEDFE